MQRSAWIACTILLLLHAAPTAGHGADGQRHDEALHQDYDYVVAQDGSGDYTTIQAAIDGAKSFPPERITIFVKDGIYEEKVKVHSWNPKISLIGESKDATIITQDDSFEEIGRGRNSTFFTYTLLVQGDDFHARNLTVRNSAGPEAGQAVALHVEADRAMFENCRLLGNQDTVYAAGEGARQYFKDCYIEGTTDFIFGQATAVFENCRLHAKEDSYITAASTPEGEPFGFVFINCTLTAAPDVDQVFLGRPWRDHAQTVFIQSEMGPHIRPEGWHNWSRPEAEETVQYAEYENTGPGADRSRRVEWSKQLSLGEVARYTKANILGGDADEDWYRGNEEKKP